MTLPVFLPVMSCMVYLVTTPWLLLLNFILLAITCSSSDWVLVLLKVSFGNAVPPMLNISSEI